MNNKRIAEIKKSIDDDFKPILERELKYRILKEKMINLGCPHDIAFDDFSVFFYYICHLQETLADKQKIKDVLNDSEYFFGWGNIHYLKKCIDKLN